MNFLPKVNDSTYYLGVNDRTKELFEGLWPIPNGVAYNSYLIKDEKNVLLDTVDICYSERFLQRLESALEGAPLHYLIVNHMEPDHSGSIALLRTKYPDVQIVGNKKTLDMVMGYFGINTNCLEVEDGGELNIGSRALKFVFAPMVHWPEVMFTYDPKEKTLFSADAFGSFGSVDGGIFDDQVCREKYLQEVYRYYSNIVGKYGTFTQKALAKASGIEIDTICSTHGPVWRTHKAEIVSLYDRLSRYEGEEGVVVAYGSMYGHTEEVAEVIGRSLAAHGIKRVVLHNVSKSHASYIIADVFRYRGLIIGSPTYNNELYPEIDSLLTKLQGRLIPNRLYSCFGGFTWNGAAVKKLIPFGEAMKWESVGNPVEIKMSMNGDQEAAAWELGRVMAERLIAERK